MCVSVRYTKDELFLFVIEVCIAASNAVVAIASRVGSPDISVPLIKSFKVPTFKERKKKREVVVALRALLTRYPYAVFVALYLRSDVLTECIQWKFSINASISLLYL